jgi:hypothetical protein
MRRLLTGLLGATLVLGACGGDDGGDDDAAAVTSIPDDTTSTTTSTTEPEIPPPDVIPSDPSLITEEYVERVLNELFVVANESLLRTMQQGLVDETVIDMVEATSPESGVADDVNRLIQLASEGFPGLKPKPGPITAKVTDVLTADADCIFAEVSLDRSAVVEPPSSQDSVRSFARLLPATEEQKATGLNPTAWVLDDLPATSDGTAPALQC